MSRKRLRRKAASSTPSTAVEPVAIAVASYSEMPWRDLVALAKSRGISVYRKNRAQLEADLKATVGQGE